MSNVDDRKMLREKALQKMKWTASNVSLPGYVHQIAPLDKAEFVRLLKLNFNKLDRNRDQGISREEIAEALMNVSELSADEHVMLQLLVRYFDFIADLVADGEGKNKVITKQDVEVLAQFLLNSDLTLEELYLWCSGASEPSLPFTPPPLSK